MPAKKKKKRKPRSRGRDVATPVAPPQSEQSAAPADKRRERLEARREAKTRALLAARRRYRLRRVARLVVVAGSALLVVWFLFVRGGAPDEIRGYDVQGFDLFISESRAGTLHQAESASYESRPPVSGSHAPGAAPCGTYAQPLPDEQMVHTLEHGGVGILYALDAPVKQIRDAEALVKSFPSHVFSEPYTGLESPFATVAWGYLMEMDSYDEAAIRDFVEAFRAGGDAPEANQECPMTSEASFEPAPSGSPPPVEETPHVDETPHE